MPEAACPEPTRQSWWRHAIVTAAGIAIAVLAIVSLHRMASEVTLAHVVTAARAVPLALLVAAAAATALSYVLLTGYDALALRHLGYRLGFGMIALASFTSFTVSHTLGLTVLTGGTVRYRLYTRAGVRPKDIVLIVALCGWTFWLGIVLAAGLGLTIAPDIASVAAKLPVALDRGIGLVLLGGAAAYVTVAAVWRGEMRVFGLAMRLPGFGATLAQVVVGGLDLVAAAAALYVLLPTAGLPPFLVVVVVYALAMIAGALSHAPGGLGVFETVILALLSRVDHGGVLAALMLFRLFYTVVPFVAGVALLVRSEAAAVRNRARGAG